MGSVKTGEIINRLLMLFAGKIQGLARKFYIAECEKRVQPWLADKGEKTHRLNYDLDANSIVFDLGGYEGQWASDIFAMYCCEIYVFEPAPEFFDGIQRRFKNNSRIIVENFGLSNADYAAHLNISADGSSIYKSSETAVPIRFHRAIDYFRERCIDRIDLLKINIEGGEYDLLDHLIEEGFVANINNIQVQFHDFVDNASSRMTRIQRDLARTHYLTYQYPYIWENWRRNA